jgi:hypothetical protein
MAANVLTFNQSVYVEQTWCFWRHSLQELNQFTLAVYQHMVTQVSLSHYGFITNIARMIEVFSNATWNIIFWHSLQESNPFNLAVYQHNVTQVSLSHYGFITNIARILWVSSNGIWNLDVFLHSYLRFWLFSTHVSIPRNVLLCMLLCSAKLSIDSTWIIVSISQKLKELESTQSK